MLLALTGCQNTDQRMNAAAAIQGQIRASVQLPDLPADCRKQEAHAAIPAGAELDAVLVRERGALRRSNARVTRCAGFYDQTKSNFGEGK